MAKGKGKGTARTRGGTGTPARTPGTPGTPSGLPRDSSGNVAASGAPSSSRRVLPQRIRRAAGGGAEGVRELEEMIVDWLERFGAYSFMCVGRHPLGSRLCLQPGLGTQPGIMTPASYSLTNDIPESTLTRRRYRLYTARAATTGPDDAPSDARDPRRAHCERACADYCGV